MFNRWYMLIVMLPMPAYSQTVNPTDKCAENCEYTDWALNANCKQCGLTSVPIGCAGAELLDLRHNQITALPVGAFEGFVKLRFLDIELIGLEDIAPGAFTGNVNLIHIYLQLNSLVVIRRNTFQGVPNLKQLFLNSNHIRTLEDGAFDGIPNLETLFLSDNNISDLAYDMFHSLKMLRFLYIENNHISVLHKSSFKGLTSLRHLSLSGNDLVHIPLGAFDDLHNLRALKLAFNKIAYISLPQLPRLTHLDLYNNNLTSVKNLTNHLTQPKRKRKRRSNATHSKVFLVFLADNPLNCDCEIEPLRIWMQMHYDEIHEHHRGNATCASPKELSEVSLCSQVNSLCPFTTDTGVSAPWNSPTVQSNDHPSPTLMPTTIVMLTLSSIVLVSMLVLLLFVWFTRRGGKMDYKRQTSSDSDQSKSV